MQLKKHYQDGSRFVISILVSIFLFLITIDNLRAWKTAGSNSLISVLFDFVGHQQFAWGMYSFNLSEAKVLKVRIYYDETNFQEFEAPYGFRPNWKKSPYENFIPFAATRKDLSTLYAKYICQNPKEINSTYDLKNPYKISLILVKAPFPSLRNYNNYGFFFATSEIFIEEKC